MILLIHDVAGEDCPDAIISFSSTFRNVRHFGERLRIGGEPRFDPLAGPEYAARLPLNSSTPECFSNL
jgi:hypothetical protein